MDTINGMITGSGIETQKLDQVLSVEAASYFAPQAPAGIVCATSDSRRVN